MAQKEEISTLGDSEIISTITSRLAQYDINPNIYPETSFLSRKAAVLLPITVRNGEIHLLLTKRSQKLRTHPSTVAFPGGVRDSSDDSDIFTALREAEEEIGLPPSQVKVLAVLPRGITLPNIIVYPVVGLIPNNFEPKINPDEVQSAFFIPLKEFLSSNVTKYHFKMQGKSFPTYSLNYDSGEEIFVIYGFTAFYCILLARILFNDDIENYCAFLQDYFSRMLQHVQSKQLNSRL